MSAGEVGAKSEDPLRAVLVAQLHAAKVAILKWLLDRNAADMSPEEAERRQAAIVGLTDHRLTLKEAIDLGVSERPLPMPDPGLGSAFIQAKNALFDYDNPHGTERP